MTNETKALKAAWVVFCFVFSLGALMYSLYCYGRAEGIREADARWIRMACDLDLYPKSNCTKAALERQRKDGVRW